MSNAIEYRKFKTYAARFGIVLEGALDAGGVPCSVDTSSSSSDDCDILCRLRNVIRSSCTRYRRHTYFALLLPLLLRA